MLSGDTRHTPTKHLGAILRSCKLVKLKKGHQVINIDILYNHVCNNNMEYNVYLH